MVRLEVDLPHRKTGRFHSQFSHMELTLLGQQAWFLVQYSDDDVRKNYPSLPHGITYCAKAKTTYNLIQPLAKPIRNGLWKSFGINIDRIIQTEINV